MVRKYNIKLQNLIHSSLLKLYRFNLTITANKINVTDTSVNLFPVAT